MDRSVTAKLGNMESPQMFTVYTYGYTTAIIVQSDQSIGQFDGETGMGKLNTQQSLYELMGNGLPYQFPPEFVKACAAMPPQPIKTVTPRSFQDLLR